MADLGNAATDETTPPTVSPQEAKLYDYDLQGKINLVESLIEALRSGTYQQTRSRLRDHGGFCCLGVACDIYSQRVGEGFWVEKLGGYGLGTRHAEYKFMVRSGDTIAETNPSVLPKRVAKEFGFDMDDPQLLVNPRDIGGTESLAALNDNGFTFDQIADLIEHFILGTLKAYKRPLVGQRIRVDEVVARFGLRGVVGTVITLDGVADERMRNALRDQPCAFLISVDGGPIGTTYEYVGFMDTFTALDEAGNPVKA